MADIEIHSNVDEAKKALKNQAAIVLEALGLEAQGNAIDEISKLVYDAPESPNYVRTGRLRNSITWVTSTGQGKANTQGGEAAKPEDYKPNGEPDDDKVYIGTNVEYAPYVELGTLKMGPRPFLKNAIMNHQEKYKQIVKEGLGK